MFQSCKFIPLVFTFSITHLGAGYFQQIPSTQSKSYVRGALCVWGEWPGHGGEGCKWVWVFSLLPPQTLLTPVHGSAFGGEAVSSFSFLWPDN